MRFVLAAAILAQTVPISVASETKGRVEHNRRERRQRLQQLLLRKSAEGNKIEDLLLGKTNWLHKRHEHNGVLKNDNAARSSFTECRIAAKGDADVGILGCAADEYCVASDSSSLGGFCMTNERNGRLLEDTSPLDVCDPDFIDSGLYDCDCSLFDLETKTGQLTCIYDYGCFFAEYCGSLVAKRVITDEIESAEYCYKFVTPSPVEICYGLDSIPACSFSVDGVTCNSCQVLPSEDDVYFACYEFDCTNTIANVAGNDCDNDSVIEGVFPNAFQTLAPTPDFFVCDICGGGRVPTIPDGLVEIPTQGTLNCTEIETAANIGGILEAQCPLLQPFVQVPCGCAEILPTDSPAVDATPAPVPAAPTCFSTTTEILLAQLANPPVKNIVICPGTTINIGLPANAEFSEFVGGDIPLTPLHDDVTIMCGDDGSSDNECKISGGLVQMATSVSNPFVQGKITTHNLKVKGLTFTGDLTSIPGFGSVSVLLSAPGDNMVFEDCLFQFIKAEQIVGNQRNTLTDPLDYPSFSSSVTFDRVWFADVAYGASILTNADQTMNLKEVSFENLMHEDCGCNPPIPVINNIRGIMDMSDSSFRVADVVTSVVYWSAFTNTSSFSFSGNTQTGIQIIDKDIRDPSEYCEGGLMVDREQDGSLGTECYQLFQDFSTPPPGSIPPTLPPLPSMPPVDMSMSMSMSLGLRRRDLEEFEEALDSEFGRF